MSDQAKKIMTSLSVKPSEVRRIILNEHSVIRQKMQELERLTKAKNYPALRESVMEFQVLFSEHLKNEETILWPIIKTVDSWGPVRIEAMNKEHAEQRKMIAGLNDVKPEKLIQVIKDLIRVLAADMVQEEKEFLNAEILRDDVITSGFGG